MIQNSTNTQGSPLIMGIIMTGVGLAFLFFVGGTETFTCSRINNICSLENTKIFSSQKNVAYNIPISTIVSAKVNSERGNKGSMMYSLGLETTQGFMPVSSYSSSDYSGMQSRANQINNFLRSGQTSLQVKDEKLLIRFFCGFFILIGIFLLWSSMLNVLKILLALIFYGMKKQ